nr:MAG TPA: hypothetical protein [Caudoviricetes sp.]
MSRLFLNFFKLFFILLKFFFLPRFLYGNILFKNRQGVF